MLETVATGINYVVQPISNTFQNPLTGILGEEALSEKEQKKRRLKRKAQNTNNSIVSNNVMRNSEESSSPFYNGPKIIGNKKSRKFFDSSDKNSIASPTFSPSTIVPPRLTENNVNEIEGKKQSSNRSDDKLFVAYDSSENTNNKFSSYTAAAGVNTYDEVQISPLNTNDIGIIDNLNPFEELEVVDTSGPKEIEMKDTNLTKKSYAFNHNSSVEYKNPFEKNNSSAEKPDNENPFENNDSNQNPFGSPKTSPKSSPKKSPKKKRVDPLTAAALERLDNR